MLFEQFRKEILQARLLMVEGKVQIEGEVIHVVVKRCMDMSGLFSKMPDSTKTVRPTDDQHGELTGSKVKWSKKKDNSGTTLPDGRNFK